MYRVSYLLPNLTKCTLISIILNYVNYIHAYVYDKCPDITILNETWLKSSILDGEILPNDQYKIFRWDRTHASHQPDPDNFLKFKRNGGSVLIAVSCSLQLSSCRANLKVVYLPSSTIRNEIYEFYYGKNGCGPKTLFFTSDRQENFFGISRTPIKQNTTSELKERFFVKLILQKTFLLKYVGRTKSSAH